MIIHFVMFLPHRQRWGHLWWWWWGVRGAEQDRVYNERYKKGTNEHVGKTYPSRHGNVRERNIIILIIILFLEKDR